MSLIYHVFDTRADWVFPYTIVLPEYEGQYSREYYVVPKQTITNMVTSVRASLGSKEKIRWLYLVGHGDSGWLQMGYGLGETNAYELKGLKSVLTSDAHILIHGCAVASDTSILKPGGSVDHPKFSAGQYKGGTKGSGYKFLRAVADATGAFVSGAINAQFGDKSFHYEGPTLTVAPGGAQKKSS